MTALSIVAASATLQLIVGDGPTLELGVVLPPTLQLSDAGVQGPSGASANLATMIPAGQTIGGHRAVFVGSDDMLWLADPSTALANAPIGISVTAGLAGADVAVRSTGLVTETAWNWSPGAIYLGVAGLLTQTPPTSGSVVKMGIAAGPDRMRVGPQFMVSLGG